MNHISLRDFNSALSSDLATFSPLMFFTVCNEDISRADLFPLNSQILRVSAKEAKEYISINILILISLRHVFVQIRHFTTRPAVYPFVRSTKGRKDYKVTAERLKWYEDYTPISVVMVCVV